MTSTLLDQIAKLQRTLEAVAHVHAPAAFSSSLSAEDMVITDVILTSGIDIEIFVIDTGRLHAETLALIDAIRRRYGYELRVFRPDPDAVASFVARNGRDAFYRSPGLRHTCCDIRKVEPLARALQGKKAWITGLRREHSAARLAIPDSEHDARHRLLKVNPLVEWTEDDVWAHVRANNVPYSALYDLGYRSIGCAPCTRPVLPHEDARAGRWWWESDPAKECGLHVASDGRLVRNRETA